MDHRAASLQLMRDMDIRPIPCPPRQKARFPEVDMSYSEALPKNFDEFETEASKDWNIGGWFSGKNVDVDIDGNEPLLMEALDCMLELTPTTFGRKSRPRTHRIYRVQEEWEHTQFSHVWLALKRIPEFKVEVRGGSKSGQMHTLMPGSIHPSGEEVQWDEVTYSEGCSAVSMVTVGHLIKRIRMAVAAAVIASTWIDGIRNDLSLALPGMLWRISKANELNEFGMQLSYEDCVEIFNCVLKIGDPNVADRRQRILNFNNTFQAMNEDPEKKTTGAARYAKIVGVEGPKVIGAIISLLSDNPDTDMMDRYADNTVVLYPEGTAVLLDRITAGGTKYFMTKEQANNALGDKKINLGEKKMRLSDWIFTSPMVKRVYGIEFEPSTNERLLETHEGTVVNVWGGFWAQPAEQSYKIEFNPLLDEYFTEILCKGDLGRRDWLLSWVADIFQNPGNRPGTTLILTGAQGAGKTFLGEKVIAPLLGPSLYAHYNDLSKLSAKFNSTLSGRLLLHVDESSLSNRINIINQTKSIITDERIGIERKGIDVHYVKNHARLLITSNSETESIHIDADEQERRFTVFGVGTDRAADVKWWARIRDVIAKDMDGNRKSNLLRAFMEYPVDRELIMRPHVTIEKRRMQGLAIGDQVNWILTRMRDGHILSDATQKSWWEAFCEADRPKNETQSEVIVREGWPEFVYVPTLIEDYRNYLRGLSRFIPKGSLLNVLAEVFPPDFFTEVNGNRIRVRSLDTKTGVVTRRRISIHQVPTIEQIKEFLIQKYGAVIEHRVKDIKENVREDIDITDYDALKKSGETEY